MVKQPNFGEWSENLKVNIFNSSGSRQFDIFIKVYIYIQQYSSQNFGAHKRNSTKILYKILIKTSPGLSNTIIKTKIKIRESYIYLYTKLLNKLYETLETL